MVPVYLSLGGNIGDTVAVLMRAAKEIAAIERVENVKLSRFYETTPVSDIPQRSYVNVVCRLWTALPLKKLAAYLWKIERRYGSKSRVKNVPRVLDVDILFFHSEYYHDDEFMIPHPRWKERLFVLAPLSDLAKKLYVPSKEGSLEEVDIIDMLITFSNENGERVKVI